MNTTTAKKIAATALNTWSNLSTSFMKEWDGKDQPTAL